MNRIFSTQYLYTNLLSSLHLIFLGQLNRENYDGPAREKKRVQNVAGESLCKNGGMTDKGTIKTERKDIECDYVPWVKPDQDSL
jgi:hypothetical protein